MEPAEYTNYDDLPLFLNAEIVEKVPGIFSSSSYELMHEPRFPALRVGNRMVVPKGSYGIYDAMWDDYDSAKIAPLRGTLEDRLSSLSFKHSVEVDMMAGILADGFQFTEDDLCRRRAESINNVKRTNGRISFKKRVRESWEDNDPWQD